VFETDGQADISWRHATGPLIWFAQLRVRGACGMMASERMSPMFAT
jgi:hypothetical protein